MRDSKGDQESDSQGKKYVKLDDKQRMEVSVPIHEVEMEDEEPESNIELQVQERAEKLRQKMLAREQQSPMNQLHYSGPQPSSKESVFDCEFASLSESIGRHSFPKVLSERPLLDLTVKVIFDEDVSSGLCPKVEQLEFRVNAGTPIEIAAKILAIQNDHKDDWANYEFSLCKQRKGLNEEKIDDLAKSFGFYNAEAKSNIILFYKVKDLHRILEAQFQNNQN